MEARESNIKVLEDSLSSEGLMLKGLMLGSIFTLSSQREDAKILFGMSLVSTLIPFVRAPPPDLKIPQMWRGNGIWDGC